MRGSRQSVVTFGPEPAKGFGFGVVESFQIPGMEIGDGCSDELDRGATQLPSRHRFSLLCIQNGENNLEKRVVFFLAMNLRE